MTVTMTIEEYLELKSKASRTDLIQEKLNIANVQRVEFMKLYALIEDYAVEKHGLNLQEFAQHLKECEKNGLFRSSNQA